MAGNMASEPLSERVRARIERQMREKDLEQQDVAGIINWSQSRVSKVLAGKRRLTVDDMAALCFAVGLPVSEAVRDLGMEFYAEMTPTEMRVLERLREFPKDLLDAHLKILQVRQTSAQPERYAGSKPLGPFEKRKARVK